MMGNHHLQRLRPLRQKERYRSMRGDIGPGQYSTCQSPACLVWQLPHERGSRFGSPAAVRRQEAGEDAACLVHSLADWHSLLWEMHRLFWKHDYRKTNSFLRLPMLNLKLITSRLGLLTPYLCPYKAHEKSLQCNGTPVPRSGAL
jgi:hypothetical protein